MRPKGHPAIWNGLTPARQGCQSSLSGDAYGRKLEKVEAREKLQDFQWDLHLLILDLIANTLYSHNRNLFTQALEDK